MTLRNSIAEQRWIAALDQRERRVWTQLVCVCVCCTLHWYLGQCVTLCVCVCVCQRERRHPARSLWKGTAMPGPSRSPPAVLTLFVASCCAVNLLVCWPSHREVEGKWDATRLRPAEGAETSTSSNRPLLSVHLSGTESTKPDTPHQILLDTAPCLSNLYCFHTLAAFFSSLHFSSIFVGTDVRNTWMRTHMCRLTYSHTKYTRLKNILFYAWFNFASTSVPVRWWGQWCQRHLGQKETSCAWDAVPASIYTTSLT